MIEVGVEKFIPADAGKLVLIFFVAEQVMKVPDALAPRERAAERAKPNVGDIDQAEFSGWRYDDVREMNGPKQEAGGVKSGQERRCFTEQFAACGIFGVSECRAEGLSGNRMIQKSMPARVPESKNFFNANGGETAPAQPPGVSRENGGSRFAAETPQSRPVADHLENPSIRQLINFGSAAVGFEDVGTFGEFRERLFGQILNHTAGPSRERIDGQEL